MKAWVQEGTKSCFPGGLHQQFFVRFLFTFVLPFFSVFLHFSAWLLLFSSLINLYFDSLTSFFLFFPNFISFFVKSIPSIFSVFRYFFFSFFYRMYLCNVILYNNTFSVYQNRTLSTYCTVFPIKVLSTKVYNNGYSM